MRAFWVRLRAWVSRRWTVFSARCVRAFDAITTTDGVSFGICVALLCVSLTILYWTAALTAKLDEVDRVRHFDLERLREDVRVTNEQLRLLNERLDAERK